MDKYEEIEDDLATSRIRRPNSKLHRSESGSKKAQIKAKLRKKRRRRRRINLLLFIGIIAAIALFIWAEQQRRSTLSQLKQTEETLEQIQGSTQSGDEVAQRVLSEVRKLMVLPEDPEPTVATIIDVAKLRETSDFYNKAKDGDHLVVTEDRAILYDSGQKLIVDVVPVRLTEESPSPPTAPPPVEEPVEPTESPLEAIPIN